MDEPQVRTKRRRRHRTLWRRGTSFRARFYLATFLTILAVAYVVVPFASNLLASIGEYQPQYYDPKDAPRLDFLADGGDRAARSMPRLFETMFSPDGALGVGLVVLVGIMWLTIVAGGARHRSLED